MLLAQKPPPALNLGHRRHPASMSAIVVPHPSNTPGMFALAKPLRAPHRAHPRSQSPRCPPRGRLHRPPVVVERPSHLSEHTRGRPKLELQQHQQKQEQQQRASSIPPASVEAPVTSQEEAPVPTPPVSTPPPLVRAAAAPQSRRSRNKSTHAATMTTSNDVLSSPSPSPLSDNNNARAVRVPSPLKQLSPSAPIAVPTTRRAQTPPRRQIARSDPSISKLTINTGVAAGVHPRHNNTTTTTRKDKRRKNKSRRNQLEGIDSLPLADWDFPARPHSDDDVAAEEDDDEPTTPVRQTGNNDRVWLEAFNDGPKTAPLQPTGTQTQFPFFAFPPRANVVRTKTPVANGVLASVTPPRSSVHRRAPSQPATLGRSVLSSGAEGIFQFSEDEGTPAKDGQKRLSLLFATARKAPKQRESVDGRALFASSSFQLAPEPVDLPKPSFLPRPNQA